MGSCKDITQQCWNKQTLLKNEAKYRMVIESLGVEYFFYRQATEGTFTYISQTDFGLFTSRSFISLHEISYGSSDQFSRR